MVFVRDPLWRDNARNWMEKNLASCPFCKKPSRWDVRFEYRLGLNRYHFKCPNCLSVLSISVAAVTGFSFRDRTLIVENVGVDGSLKNLVGTKQSLNKLQEIAK